MSNSHVYIYIFTIVCDKETLINCLLVGTGVSTHGRLFLRQMGTTYGAKEHFIDESEWRGLW